MDVVVAGGHGKVGRRLIDAAKRQGISRYVMVSAIGVTDPDRWSEQMRPYYEAKADADERLAASGLDHTIVRPGRLTDDPGSGRIDAAEQLGRYGAIPRDDVAATLLAVLDTESTIGKAFDVVSGETPIAEAVRGL